MEEKRSFPISLTQAKHHHQPISYTNNRVNSVELLMCSRVNFHLQKLYVDDDCASFHILNLLESFIHLINKDVLILHTSE